MLNRFALLIAALFALSGACAQDNPFTVEVVTDFDEPWDLAFLPDGRMLVTEKKGALYLVTQDGEKSRPISGTPDVDYGGQGGFGDVEVHPDFADNGLIYLSYAEAGVGGTRGAAVARGELTFTDNGARLGELEVIWRQYPKQVGRGHYGHRLLFHDGYLWVSSGDRQKFTPAQDMQSSIGKVLRLNDDGSVPDDNPFVDLYSENPLLDDVGVYPQVWSLGHRNPLGLAVDNEGRIWDVEMGPAGGDELNHVTRGTNYGYPLVSNGEHYDGREIPDHDTRPEFAKPAVWWTPVISPGDMLVVRGSRFDGWQDDALIAGLSSQAIIRVELGDGEAREVTRYPMGARIRSLEEGPDGAIWVLEDERGTSRGRLLKLEPAD